MLFLVPFQEMNQEIVSKLDKNGDGVDRAEFLMGMLVTMGCASERYGAQPEKKKIAHPSRGNLVHNILT